MQFDSKCCTELNLEQTLSSGQVFRWTRSTEGWWMAPVGTYGQVMRCRQDGSNIDVQIENGTIDDFNAYFQLDTDMTVIKNAWRSSANSEISVAISNLLGLRVCRQEPLECLFSFLCSSAAPVYRIRRMINGFCRELGEPIKLLGELPLFAFPILERLASTSRPRYDELGLGYRGGYVRDTAAELIARGGMDYVDTLKSKSYIDAKRELVSLPGVGAKIADCVCLFSLGKHEAVPIDTHMSRIVKRIIAPDLANRTLTPSIYDELANRFRLHFGDYAGWAQQYLFTSELHSTVAWDSDSGTHKPGNRVKQNHV